MQYITRIFAAIPTTQSVILTQNLHIRKGWNTWKQATLFTASQHSTAYVRGSGGEEIPQP